ncbi:hypothetical protein ACYZT4_17370 [Pseudomonas sp. GB2N2]
MAKYTTREYSPSDVKKLLEAASALYAPKPKVTDLQASWLLEGGIGSHIWRTQNAGHEHLENGVWKGTININFAHRLPDNTLLTDPENSIPLHALQRWAFALRSGLLGYFPGPTGWQRAVRWALSLTSWAYLHADTLEPQKFGFNLLDLEEVKELAYQLSLDNWSEALQITSRLFTALHKFTFNRKPTKKSLAALPYVDTVTTIQIKNKLRSEGLYTVYTRTPESLISRVFLANLIQHTPEGFRSEKVRAFLRQFEGGLAEEPLLLRGKTLTNHPTLKARPIEDVGDTQVTEKSMLAHSTHFDYFLAGCQIDNSLIPYIERTARDVVHELNQNIAPSQHQRLIAVDDGLAVLNEAARWIINFGDNLLEIYSQHLTNCKAIDNRMATEGYNIMAAEKKQAFDLLIAKYKDLLGNNSGSPKIIEFAGLNLAFKKHNREIISGDLTLAQAIYILIGACTYALGMMKPMREGEIGTIPYNCILRNNLTSGCWIRVPNEKSAVLGYSTQVERPVPYLTYKAVFLLQKLGIMTAKHFFGLDAKPTRLLYFPSSNDGMSPPTKGTSSGALGIAITRCMDYFCDHLNLALDEHGRRQYFRIHELRKFFLLTLSWDEKYHGDELAAWMAAHRDADYTRAYTDANIDGAELSDLEARYIESKIIDIELSSGNRLDSPTVATYRKILKELKVDSISSLAPDKFSSYVRNAVASGHLSAKLIKIRSIIPGDKEFTDLAVIIGKDG